MINIEAIRQDFPILQREVYGKPLIYFDNGATTQKPRCMVESITEQYYSVNANVHRGVQTRLYLPAVQRSLSTFWHSALGKNSAVKVMRL